MFNTEIEAGKAKVMGVKLRAITLIVATGVVTLSSVANAHHRHRATRGEHWYGVLHSAFALGLELLPLRPLSLRSLSARV